MRVSSALRKVVEGWAVTHASEKELRREETKMEFVIGFGLLVAAGAATVYFITEVVMPALRAIAPYALMALGAFVLFSVAQADAANAATISVPAGVVVGGALATLL